MNTKIIDKKWRTHEIFCQHCDCLDSEFNAEGKLPIWYYSIQFVIRQWSARDKNKLTKMCENSMKNKIKNEWNRQKERK